MPSVFEANSIKNLVRMAGREEEYFDEATKAVAKRQTEPEFDAVYFDRDGAKYPAHIQHVHVNEPGNRVWVDDEGKLILFKAVDGDNKVIGWYRITTGEDYSQLQEQINQTEALAIAERGKEYKCITIMPGGAGFLDMQSAKERFANLFKIPVVDMLVEFGNGRTGSRINSVSYVRHARYAPQGLMTMRVPCYVEKHELDTQVRLHPTNEADQLRAKNQALQAALDALRGPSTQPENITPIAAEQLPASEPDTTLPAEGDSQAQPEPENKAKPAKPKAARQPAPRKKSS